MFAFRYAAPRYVTRRCHTCSYAARLLSESGDGNHCRSPRDTHSRTKSARVLRGPWGFSLLTRSTVASTAASSAVGKRNAIAVGSSIVFGRAMRGL